MDEPQWFAVYVRSRHEAKIAKQWQEREIEHFYPREKTERRWSDRVVELELPLFPGYLFVRIAREQRAAVVETPGVLYLVGAGGRPEVVEDEEIDQMKAAMAAGARKEYVGESGVKRGDRVRVRSGPMRGAQGILVHERGKSRLVMQVASVSQAMSVEVSVGDVELMETGAQILESPRADVRGGADAARLGMQAGAQRSEAADAKRGGTGDPLQANGMPGLCPQRHPGTSVGTPNRS